MFVIGNVILYKTCHWNQNVLLLFFVVVVLIGKWLLLVFRSDLYVTLKLFLYLLIIFYHKILIYWL